MAKQEDPKKMAYRMARYMGCSGVHQNDDGVWMPCSSFEELQRRSNAAEPRKKSAYVEDEKPKTRKKRGSKPKGWEELTGRGPVGFETLPGGGLVSMAVGKSKSPCWPGYVMVGMKPGENGEMVPNCVPADSASKGDVIYGRARPRLGDPDVYTDANSARERSRMMGCIGISRRQTPTGEWVWMPCSNMSDYRRRTGRGQQARRDRERSERRLARRLSRYMKSESVGIETKAKKRKARSDRLAATPALPSERVRGSSQNPKGSARSTSSGSSITLDETTLRALNSKVRQHNERMREKEKPAHAMASLGMLKSVWRRGAGAFSVSHRPGMTRSRWAFARVNAFLHLLSTGKPKNERYTTDNDLLPKDHPRKAGSVKSLTMPVTPQIF